MLNVGTMRIRNAQWVLLAVLACNPVLSEPSGDNMTKGDFFKFIDSLANSRPFSKIRVSALMSTELTQVPNPGNPHFIIYKGENTWFSSIELREPTLLASKKGGFVNLTLREGCLSPNDISEKFGVKTPRPPRPGRPAHLPKYDVYSRDWGEVRFGFQEDCLVSVVLDAV